MGREIKRVMLDFDWPLETVWQGYVMPDELRAIHCRACDGSGLNPATKRLSDDWHDFDETGQRWHDKLTQDEVDHLVANGRLWRLTHMILETPTAVMSREEMLAFIARNSPGADPVDALAQGVENGLIEHAGSGYRQLRGWVWRPGAIHPTAHQVNTEFAHRVFGHDGINKSLMVRFRAEKLGIWGHCERCGGEGFLFRDEAHRDAHEAWESKDPPVGPGWQVWETVSEGAPVSPVFADPERLVDWLCGGGYPEDAARRFVFETGWAPSFTLSHGKLREDIEALGAQGSRKTC